MRRIRGCQSYQQLRLDSRLSGNDGKQAEASSHPADGKFPGSRGAVGAWKLLFSVVAHALPELLQHRQKTPELPGLHFQAVIGLGNFLFEQFAHT